MSIFLLAYLSGALTIVSPCILPVLPFAFGRADHGFLRGGLPLLAGMAISFAVTATLATLAGGWATDLNIMGRTAAMTILFLFGLMLLSPGLAERFARPFVALGARLSDAAETGRLSRLGPASSFALGAATGLLWAPCAGPILGLILTSAALRGANIETGLLLFTYAAGAASSLALALLAGERVFQAMKRSLGFGEWARRGLGATVLLAVAVMAVGLDTSFLARVSIGDVAALEQHLLDGFGVSPGRGPVATSDGSITKSPTDHDGELSIEGAMPSLGGLTAWLNSPPLAAEGLKGKVVLVDFWTYSCINCLRTLPYLRAWSEKYKDRGLVVIGVHAPEFAFEKNIDNVRKAVADLQIFYPVAIDNNYVLWRRFANRYWPAHYFIDALGRIRHHHFGEGDYEGSERVIQQLLADGSGKSAPTELVRLDANAGVSAAADGREMLSPETYIGYRRAANFVSPGGEVPDKVVAYERGAPRLNEWSLFGRWRVGAQHATLDADGGGVVYRFHARDLNLVLGSVDGRPIRFRIAIDGMPPGDDHGLDVGANGEGMVTEHRLYQLVRQNSVIVDRTFEIVFLAGGAEAYAFTFG